MQTQTEQNSRVSNLPLEDRNNLEKLLGQDANDESYQRVPITNFGLEMLKSMGWHEGRGLGKNPANALMNPIEYVPHHHRAGLGAIPKMSAIETVNGKKVLKKLDMIAAPTKDGKTRNYIDLGEKLIERKAKKPELNSKVLIVKGKYADLCGRITNINPSRNEYYIELEINESIVKINTNEIILYDEQEEKKTKGTDSEHLSDEESDYANSENKKNNYNKKSDKLNNDNGQKKKERKKKRLKWISPNIMIRVISKKPRDGRLYDKKLEVMDILDDYTFVAMDEKGQMYEDLKEKQCETVIPKPQKLVKIVHGEHKGKIGTLLERNKSKNQVQVQLLDTLEIFLCSQDDCSQYVVKKI